MQDGILIDQTRGYTRVSGMMNGREVISFCNQIEGQWICSTSTCLPTDVDDAFDMLDMYADVKATVEKLKTRVFKKGDAVYVNKTASFYRGWHGVVEFVEPNEGRVWILREGTQTPTAYNKHELDLLESV